MKIKWKEQVETAFHLFSTQVASGKETLYRVFFPLTTCTFDLIRVFHLRIEGGIVTIQVFFCTWGEGLPSHLHIAPHCAANGATKRREIKEGEVRRYAELGRSEAKCF